ncbi:MAG: nuclear transport factor 2 family protein [Acidimicrobiia bacterium]|nr:nuclear transport factor 2 family protein [Acidimicrobiia bacterium]
MNLLNRLRVDLREIAAGADVSESAWDDICARIDAELSDPRLDSTIRDIPLTKRRRRSWRTMIAVAAAAATAMIVATVGLDSWSGNDSGRLETAGTQALETSGDPVTRVVSAYVDAINRGDVEGAMAQFDPDATMTGRHRSIRNSSGQASLRQWASRVAWLVGQQATISEVRCTPSKPTADNTTATCTWRLNDAVSRAVEQPGSDGSIEVTVADGEIVSYDETFDWTESQAMFTMWLHLNHPDQAMIDPLDWWFDLSTEPAEGFGADYAEFVQEWLDACAETSLPNASEGAAPDRTSDTEGNCFEPE